MVWCQPLRCVGLGSVCQQHTNVHVDVAHIPGLRRACLCGWRVIWMKRWLMVWCQQLQMSQAGVVVPVCLALQDLFTRTYRVGPWAGVLAGQSCAGAGGLVSGCAVHNYPFRCFNTVVWFGSSMVSPACMLHSVAYSDCTWAAIRGAQLHTWVQLLPLCHTLLWGCSGAAVWHGLPGTLSVFSLFLAV